jgi:hypothetical protein
MARKTKFGNRVTLALRLADGTMLPVEASVHSMRFIGRLSRISAFGPPGTRIRAHFVSSD